VLLTPDQVSQALGVTRATLWNWQRRGNFIKPLRLSRGRVAYRVEDVEAWLDSRPRIERKPAVPAVEVPRG
jgi:predicted DNA-binding transcriptional regulator AlpA